MNIDDIPVGGSSSAQQQQSNFFFDDENNNNNQHQNEVNNNNKKTAEQIQLELMLKNENKNDIPTADEQQLLDEQLAELCASLSTQELCNNNKDWKQRKAGFERIAASNLQSEDAEFLYQGLLSLKNSSSSSNNNNNKTAAVTSGNIYSEITHQATIEAFIEAIANTISSQHNSNNTTIVSRCAILMLNCSSQNNTKTSGFTSFLGFLIEKPLQNSVKPKLIESCSNILRTMIRQGQQGPNILTALQNSFLTVKTPKIKCKALFVLNILVEELGIISILNQHQQANNNNNNNNGGTFFTSTLFPLFNDADPKVRKEVTQVCLTCYKQSPSIVLKAVTSSSSTEGALRETQQAELKKAFEKIDEEKADDANQNNNNNLTASSSFGNNNQQQSLFSTNQKQQLFQAKPIKLLSSLPMNEIYSTALDKNLKWKERQEIVEQKLVPKLVSASDCGGGGITLDDDYSEFVKFLRELINDRQLPLEQVGLKCLLLFSKNLCLASSSASVVDAPPRHHHNNNNNNNNYSRFILPSLFEKFKDPKTAPRGISTILSLFEHHLEQQQQNKNFSSSSAIIIPSIESCSDLFEKGLSSKIPCQRLETLECMTRMISLATTTTKFNHNNNNVTENDVKITVGKLGKAFLNCASDDKVEIREKFVVCMQAMLNSCSVPSRSFRDILAEVDEKMRNKIFSGVDTTEKQQQQQNNNNGSNLNNSNDQERKILVASSNAAQVSSNNNNNHPKANNNIKRNIDDDAAPPPSQQQQQNVLVDPENVIVDEDLEKYKVHDANVDSARSSGVAVFAPTSNRNSASAVAVGNQQQGQVSPSRNNMKRNNNNNNEDYHQQQETNWSSSPSYFDDLLNNNQKYWTSLLYSSSSNNHYEELQQQTTSNNNVCTTTILSGFGNLMELLRPIWIAAKSGGGGGGNHHHDAAAIVVAGVEEPDYIREQLEQQQQLLNDSLSNPLPIEDAFQVALKDAVWRNREQQWSRIKNAVQIILEDNNNNEEEQQQQQNDDDDDDDVLVSSQKSGGENLHKNFSFLLLENLVGGLRHTNWKETVFQVSNHVLEIIRLCLTKTSTSSNSNYNKSHQRSQQQHQQNSLVTFLISNILLPRWTDIKLKSQIGPILSSVIDERQSVFDQVGFSLVSRCIFSRLFPNQQQQQSTKSVTNMIHHNNNNQHQKLIVEVLEWMYHQHQQIINNSNSNQTKFVKNREDLSSLTNQNSRLFKFLVSNLCQHVLFSSNSAAVDHQQQKLASNNNNNKITFGVKLLAALLFSVGMRFVSNINQLFTLYSPTSASLPSSSLPTSNEQHLLKLLNDEMASLEENGVVSAATTVVVSSSQQQQQNTNSTNNNHENNNNLIIKPSPPIPGSSATNLLLLKSSTSIVVPHNNNNNLLNSNSMMSASSPLANASSFHLRQQVERREASNAMNQNNIDNANYFEQQQNNLEEQQRPRYDISVEVRPLLQEMTNGKDWKARHDALKAIEKLVSVTAKNHIQTAGVNDVLKSLRTRLDESSKNFVFDVIRVMKIVAEATIEKSQQQQQNHVNNDYYTSVSAAAIRPGVKIALVASLPFLGDQKPQLRDEALALGKVLFQIIGVEAVVTDVIRILNSVESQYAKSGMLELIVGQLYPTFSSTTINDEDQSLSSSASTSNNNISCEFSKLVQNGTAKTVLSPFLQPLFTKLLLDRSLDVRTEALNLLTLVVCSSSSSSISPSILKQMHSSVKPADVLLLTPMLEKALSVGQKMGLIRQQPTQVQVAVSAPSQLQQIKTNKLPLPPTTSQTQQENKNLKSIVDDASALPTAKITSHNNNNHEDRREHHSSSSSSSSTLLLHQHQYSVDNIIAAINNSATTSAGIEKICQTIINKTNEGLANAVVVVDKDKDDYEEQVSSTSTSFAITPRLVLSLTARLRIETSMSKASTFDANLVTSLLEALVACFSVSSFVWKLDSNFLFQMLGLTLELLQCPLIVSPPPQQENNNNQQQSSATATIMDHHRSILKNVNYLTYRLIKQANPENIFDAIFTRLTYQCGEYLESFNNHNNNISSTVGGVGNSSEKIKSVETILRCLFRVEMNQVPMHCVIRCVHEFLSRYPPSAFKNKNEVAIRSVKQILSNMCEVQLFQNNNNNNNNTTVSSSSSSLQETAENIRNRCRDLIGPSSLVFSFVSMCLDKWLSTTTTTTTNHDVPTNNNNSSSTMTKEDASNNNQKSLHKPPSSVSPVPHFQTETNSTNSNFVTNTSIRLGAAQSLFDDEQNNNNNNNHLMMRGFVTTTTANTHGNGNNNINTSRSSASRAGAGTLMNARSMTPTPAVVAFGNNNQQQSPVVSPSKKQKMFGNPTKTRTSLSEKSPNNNNNTNSTTSIGTDNNNNNNSYCSSSANATINSNNNKLEIVTAMFAKARKHETTDQGILEIVEYLKQHSRQDEDYLLHYNKCSEAFRMYLDRRIEKLM